MLTSILSALLLTTTLNAPPATVDADAVDAVVEAYRAQTTVPGVAVAVTRGATVVRTAGYGRTAGGAPVSEHTAMAVASVSKSFTALAVMQLVQDGRVRLNDPVHAHLPEFAPADPRGAEVTVRQLLEQTSGLSDRTAAPEDGVRTLREAVAAMRGAELAADPGTRWEYHNRNFQVAARLVEVVGGSPFRDHLRRRVFEPLGMGESETVDTERDLPPSARGHLKVLGAAVALPEPAAFGNGSGGVLSSARDMAAWLVAQNNGGRGPTGGSVATPETVAATHTPSARSDSYALGWFTGATGSGAPLLDHGGDLFTSTAYQAVLPASGYGVAVMANTGSQYGDAQAIGERLIALIEGRERAPAEDPYSTVDVVLLAAGLGAGAGAVRGVVRARRWAADRRVGPWTVVRLAALLLPVLLLAALDGVVGFLYRGREVSWLQVAYLYPVFVLVLAVTALGCLAVAAARVAALVRRQGPAR
ncbi:beta-lactamase family protein [Actinokineospora sp. PR83]|uniref:serine hydrolase domain-containing protein n=1 Tax=Actinokineospora sp. PR83 TaxID=2884908 RepID=UPI0027DF562D|nr:serine hydrolase domain-containing protein [Actinokineospora sp. PR83]MCG8916345.1 beta-lactamase family protein [Actinokineospora sp. PR83]